MDFKNAAGFVGEVAKGSEGHHVVHFLSHAMMFCVGTILEAHVVLTPAICVIGEKYKFDVYAGTHKFIENAGIGRTVEHICIHKGYNHSNRWLLDCSSDNLALLVLNTQFLFHKREHGAEFPVNRVRYGAGALKDEQRIGDSSCRYYGWGSRRNGYLIPLLINLRRVNVLIQPQEQCLAMWNYENNYLCVTQGPCKSEKYGALCPDDLGSVIICSGFAQGMMISRLVDRPCGVGFVDLGKYIKFLTCGVDDSRDVIERDTLMSYDVTTAAPTPQLIVPEVLADNETLAEYGI